MSFNGIKDFDMKKEFERLNKKFFKQEIAPNFVLKRTRSKKSIGNVKFLHQKGKEVKIVYLGLSNYYSFTREELENTLVHEMIHVLLLQRGIVDDFGGTHGFYYQYEVFRIKANFGYTVDLKGNTCNTEVSDHVRKKPLFSVILNQKYLLLYRNNPGKEHLEKLHKTLRSFAISMGDITVEYAQTRYPSLYKLRTARTVENALKRQYIIKPEIYEQIEPDIVDAYCIQYSETQK